MNEAARFIDLQVNGYAGLDFNSEELNPDTMHAACQKMRDDGVAALLPTIITDHLPLMCQRLRRIVEFRQRDSLVKEMVIGLHVEGPFINPARGYIGAHPPDAVLPANLNAAEQLLDAGDGLVRIFTLAPERDEKLAVTRALARRDIVVSAGHSDADLPVLSTAIDAGLSMFTHLGNGCPAQLPRHDNIIQRVLSLASRLRIGFIADGVHIPLFALKNYLRTAGIENCFIVSDAMSAAGLGPGTYRIGRHEVAVGEDHAARSPDGSHLIGSAVTLARSASLLREIGFSPHEIDSLTRTYPARAICVNMDINT